MLVVVVVVGEGEGLDFGCVELEMPVESGWSRPKVTGLS